MTPCEEASLREVFVEENEILEADYKPVVSWTKLERAEYMKRANRKHRKKRKEENRYELQRTRDLENELIQLKSQIKSLLVYGNMLERKQDIILPNWTDSYLLKQNYILRKESTIAQSKSYICAKLQELNNFLDAFSLTLRRSFELLNELNVTKKGKIYFYSKRVVVESNRAKLKNSLNKEFEQERSRYGKCFLKSIIVDKKQEFWYYEMKVEGVDLLTYTNAIFYTNKTNRFPNEYFEKYFDVDYDIAELDTREVPFYCPLAYKNVHFDFQAVNFSFYKPRYKAPPFVIATALYRNSKFAISIKSSIYYDEERKSFDYHKTGLSCSSITALPGTQDAVIVRASNTLFSPRGFGVMLRFYQGVMLKVKMDKF
eukprot:maker-scaffold_20-snap-gene-3.39-mRNA-1 protein AED:0.15 eAED:0.15 QI:196/1/1/1/1/1/2/100/371